MEIRCWKCNTLIRTLDWFQYIFAKKFIYCKLCDKYDSMLWKEQEQKRNKEYIKKRDEYLEKRSMMPKDKKGLNE